MGPNQLSDLRLRRDGESLSVALEWLKDQNSYNALPSVSQVFIYAAFWVSCWRERARSRRTLAELEDHRLKDLGLTRMQALRESDKPFWRK